MHSVGVEPDEYSYNALLTSMARSSCGVQDVDKVGVLSSPPVCLSISRSVQALAQVPAASHAVISSLANSHCLHLPACRTIVALPQPHARTYLAPCLPRPAPQVRRDMLARGIRLNAHLGTSLVNAYRSVPFKAGDVAEHCKQQALAIMRQLQADKLANINAFTAVIALHIEFADLPGGPPSWVSACMHWGGVGDSAVASLLWL